MPRISHAQSSRALGNLCQEKTTPGHGALPLKTLFQVTFSESNECSLRTVRKCKCPSVIDWIKKKWHIYTMEYYAAIKKDGFMSFAGTWMNLEIIILSKLTQNRKPNTERSHS